MRTEVHHGVTRSVILWRRWAIKLPWGLARKPVRGWLANRSEWRQRRRRRVCRPVATLLHLVLVMPRADLVGYVDDSQQVGPWSGCSGDKGKPSSWGWFGDRYEQIDFDMSWSQVDRGIVGAIYYGWDEWRYGGADLRPSFKRWLARYAARNTPEEKCTR